MKIADLYYYEEMISGNLIKEARLRAGMTQVELGLLTGNAQSVIARWERDEVSPSLETVREVIRACGLELTFFISKFDDSNTAMIDDNLRLSTSERFESMMERVRFQERREQLNSNTRA